MTEPLLVPDPLFLSFQAELAGRYSIDRELGRGGMGVVYLAREVLLDRPVAIKLLPPELSARPELRERFLREARLAAKLSHPNIIPIHAVAEAGGFVYFVMAFVDGETISQRVQARGPLSASDGARMLREVAWALGYAHGQGLVHRDVKPDNILIEQHSGRALVADFGIAAATGEILGDGISGTPEFMSPEQALGTEVDARSDLYSLGATAYYALSGQLPFEGKTATEVLAQQIAKSAPSLATTATAVPRKLAALVDKCLSKDPANRPASAQSLADQLGLAIEQRRELPAALRAFVKRNGRMDGGGTVLALAAGLIGSVTLSSVSSVTTGVLMLGATVVALPIMFGITAARRLLKQGFTLADLAPAFRAERESIHEEHSVQPLNSFSWRRVAERILSKITRVSGAAALVLAPFVLASANTFGFARLGAVEIVLLTVFSLTGFSLLALLQLHRDVDIELWTALWTGRFGAIAFTIAGRLRGAKPIRGAVTHRATELSLAMAAEQLFAALPKASRETLQDVPATLQRLQHDAHKLRDRYNALQDALTQVGTVSLDDEYADVRLERDAVHDRMRATVAALETIRLGLLRLHAGSMTLQGLTTHIELASGQAADMERLVAAQAEVEEVLRIPQHLALTPV